VALAVVQSATLVCSVVKPADRRNTLKRAL
jgi:hypothetical protein